MHRLLMSSAAILALSAGVAVAEVKSGPPVGASAGAFQVKDITGPNQPQSLCYR